MCYLDLSVASLVYRNNNCKSIGVGKPVENSKFTRIKREREREKRDTEREERGEGEAEWRRRRVTGDSRGEDNGPFRVAPRVNVPGYSLIIPGDCARAASHRRACSRSYADYSWTENRAHSGKRRLNPRNEMPVPRSHRSSATSPETEKEREREEERGRWWINEGRERDFSEPRIRSYEKELDNGNRVMKREWSCRGDGDLWILFALHALELEWRGRSEGRVSDGTFVTCFFPLRGTRMSH